MKKIAVVIMLLLGIAAPVTAEPTAPVDNAVMFTMEELMSMNNNARNNVFYQVEKLQKARAQAEARANGLITVPNVVDALAGVDTDTVITNAEKYADIIIAFSTKLGVAAKDFVTTPWGAMITILLLLKFGGVMGFVKLVVLIPLLIWLLFAFNTRKKIKLKSWGADKKLLGVEQILVPRFSALIKPNNMTQSKEDYWAGSVSLYRIFGSIVAFICLILTFIFI